MKSDVYSWRIDPQRRSALEKVARARGTTVAGLLDRLTDQCIASESPNGSEEAEQRRLHAEVEKYAGMFRGGDPKGSQEVRKRVRERLRQRRAR
jgi:hypothetical protein